MDYVTNQINTIKDRRHVSLGICDQETQDNIFKSYTHFNMIELDDDERCSFRTYIHLTNTLMRWTTLLKKINN